jgi:hypothetical protein
MGVARTASADWCLNPVFWALASGALARKTVEINTLTNAICA